ncbi:hypothetical protein HDU88_001794 [Geranomyces variabilis]|nr:hypothetical protein HDU88_001794 [Geranomyces variabilis]
MLCPPVHRAHPRKKVVRNPDVPQGVKRTVFISRIPSISTASNPSAVKPVPDFGKLHQKWESKMMSKTGSRRPARSATTTTASVAPAAIVPERRPFTATVRPTIPPVTNAFTKPRPGALSQPSSPPPVRVAAASTAKVSSTPARRVYVTGSTPARRRVFAPRNLAMQKIAHDEFDNSALADIMDSGDTAEFDARRQKLAVGPRTPGGRPRMSLARRVNAKPAAKPLDLQELDENGVELLKRQSMYAGALRVPLKKPNLAGAALPPHTPRHSAPRTPRRRDLLAASTPLPQRTPRVAAAKTPLAIPCPADDDHMLDRFRELESLVDDIGAEVEKRAEERRATALALARAEEGEAIGLQLARAAEYSAAPTLLPMRTPSLPPPAIQRAPQLPSISAMLGDMDCALPAVQTAHVEILAPILLAVPPLSPPARDDSWRDVVGIPSSAEQASANRQDEDEVPLAPAVVAGFTPPSSDRHSSVARRLSSSSTGSGKVRREIAKLAQKEVEIQERLNKLRLEEDSQSE